MKIKQVISIDNKLIGEEEMAEKILKVLNKNYDDYERIVEEILNLFKAV